MKKLFLQLFDQIDEQIQIGNDNLLSSLKQRDEISMKIKYAGFHLMKIQVEQIICSLIDIKKCCVSELNGTFYEDMYEDLNGLNGFIFNPDEYNVYTSILYHFEEGFFNISDELKRYITKCKKINYQEFTNQLKKLAETKGNLAKIIRIVE